MGGASVRSATHRNKGSGVVRGRQEKPKSATIDIAALDALVDSSFSSGRVIWDKEKDAALLKYWPIKRHYDVARILGHSKDTCLNRYRELTCQS